MKRLVVVVVMMWLGVPSAVVGQAEFGVNAGFGALTGDEFDGAEAGPTFGATILFGIGGIQLGAGLDYSSYGTEDITEDVGQIDVLAVGRYVFSGAAVSPFVGIKAGYSRQSVDEGGSTISGNGFAGGATIGLQIPAGPIAVEISGDALYHAYGDYSTDGVPDPTSDASGMRVVGRAGIAIPFGM